MQDYDAGLTPEEYERIVAWAEHDWSSGRFLRALMPGVAVDDAQLRDLARIERQSMAPAVVGAVFLGSTRPTYDRSCRPSVPRHSSCTRSRTASFPSSSVAISPNTSPTPG